MKDKNTSVCFLDNVQLRELAGLQGEAVETETKRTNFEMWL